MEPKYTTVVPKPAEEIPGKGVQIILIAQGDGLKDRTETYTTNGSTFDLVDLRRKAIAFRDRLNADDSYTKEIQSIAGVPLDLTPIGETPPTPDDIAFFAFVDLVARYRGAFSSLTIFGCATQDDVDTALLDVQAAYEKASPTLRVRLDGATRGVV